MLAVVRDGVGWRDLALGLIGFPVVLLPGRLIRLRFTNTPLRATEPAGHLLNGLVVAALLVPSATRPATLVWLGASMLLAAWRGYAGCESLALSNWLLRGGATKSAASSSGRSTRSRRRRQVTSWLTPHGKPRVARSATRIGRRRATWSGMTGRQAAMTFEARSCAGYSPQPACSHGESPWWPALQHMTAA